MRTYYVGEFHKPMAEQYRLGFPTVLFFKNEGKKETVVGAFPETALKSKVQTLF